MPSIVSGLPARPTLTTRPPATPIDVVADAEHRVEQQAADDRECRRRRARPARRARRASCRRSRDELVGAVDVVALGRRRAARCRPAGRGARRQRLRHGHAARRPRARRRRPGRARRHEPGRPRRGVEPLVHRDYDGGVIELPARRHGAGPGDDARADGQGRPRPRHLQRRHAARRRRQGRRGRDHDRGRPPRRATRAAAPDAARSCFTPDEEIGEGATLFDSSASAPSAPTRSTARASASSGRDLHRRRGRSRSTGVDVHPGYATGKLVNAGAAGRRDRRRAARRSPYAGDHRRAARASSTSSASGDAPAPSPRIVRDFDDDLLAEHVALLRRTAERGRGRRAAGAARRRRRAAVPQHAPLPRRRARRSSRPPRRRSAPRASSRSHAHPGRHRRLAAERDGPADAQPLHRRPRVPLGARVGLGAGHGRGRGTRVRLAEVWARR